MGYMYGKCSRQLYYNNESGKVGFTENEMKQMEKGTSIHNTVEQWLKNIWPDMAIEPEVKRYFPIRLPDGTPFIIGAKADAIVHWHPNAQSEYLKTLIEIKYIYSRMAYYQTLIEKLVFSEMNVMCFQYGNLGKPQFAKNVLIPLKADLNMAMVYAGRIITSLYHMPPRFPDAHFNHPVCNKCIHKDKCYNDTLDLDIASEHDAWNTFKVQSQPFIDAVRSGKAQI
jgi:hypothetical protein